MSELKTNLQEILQEKQEKIIPENIKKDVQIFDVVGTLESGTTTSGVKLFETEEEMQADSTAKEGDLAIVYREEIQNMTAETQTQYITFPETVVLPEAFTESVFTAIKAVDSSAMFEGNVVLNSRRFDFTGHLETESIRVQYDSVDGITYTRSNFTGDSGDLTNPVDLGTQVQIQVNYPEDWNDALGYFMQIDRNTFDGLYKCSNYPLKGTYCNSYNTNTELNSIPYLSPSISRPNEVEYDYNIIIVTDSHLDTSGLYKVIDKCKVLWYGGGYGKDAVYNGKQGILIILYEPSYAESSSTNLNLVLEEYDFTIDTNPTSKRIIHNWDDVSIFPSPVYVAQDRSSVNDSYNNRWYFTSYENADYTGNGHPSTYKHTIYTVPNDITLPISHTGYSEPGEIISKVGADYYVNVYTNRYEIAPTQYTLQSSEQLLSGVIAYGKTGNIIGSASMDYTGTISPDEYNTALETAKTISGKEFYEIPYDYNTNLNTIKNIKVGDAIIARPLTNLLNPEIDNFSYDSSTGKSIDIYANDLGVANPSGYREYLQVSIRDTTDGNGFVGLQYIKKASEADIIYNSWTWKYVNQPLIDIGMYNMDMASGYDGPGWYDTAQYEWGITYTKKTQEDIDVLIDYILRANLIVYNVDTWSNATEEESQQMNDILARIIQVDKKGE